jgi:hypothetical protein
MRSGSGVVALAVVASGCELVFPLDGDGDRADAGDVTPPIDGVIADAAPYPTGPFGAPGVVTLALDNPRQPSLTGDMLELYVVIGQDLYLATRASTSDAWSTPETIPELDGTTGEDTPGVTTDGLTLYFASFRVDGAGGFDVWVSSRPDRTQRWGPPVLAEMLNTSYGESGASVWADGTVAVLESNRPDGTGPDYDLYLSQRDSTDVPWPSPRCSASPRWSVTASTPTRCCHRTS